MKPDQTPPILRRPVVATAAVVLALVLGGCGADDTNAATDVIGQGYESGDGSTKTWPAESRGEPVQTSRTGAATWWS